MYTQEEFAKAALETYEEMKDRCRATKMSLDGYKMSFSFLSNRGKPTNGAMLIFNGEDAKCEIITPYMSSKIPDWMAEALQKRVREELLA